MSDIEKMLDAHLHAIFRMAGSEAETATRAAIVAEFERLDFLHKLDHWLADQWRAKCEQRDARIAELEENLANFNVHEGFEQGGCRGCRAEIWVNDEAVRLRAAREGLTSIDKLPDAAWNGLIGKIE